MIMPSNSEVESPKAKKDRNGDIILNVAGVCWYTNLDITKRHEDLLLYRRYKEDPSRYPKYDNYDAMDKYNPEQFELVGCSYNYGRPKEWPEDTDMAPTVGGKNLYKRLFIRRRA